jgi:hypothetical protein
MTSLERLEPQEREPQEMPNELSASPRVVIEITERQWDRAKRASSAACLISDAIKHAYPHLTSVETDITTIRASDRAKGERYVWLTPQPAQDVLLAFDQGWDRPSRHRITLNGAVKVTKIKARSKAQLSERRERLAKLEAKVKRGEDLSAGERQSLTKTRRVAERPVSTGPVTAIVEEGDQGITVVGGRPLRANPTKNPNLLAGRTRVFGARRARPAQVFEEMVEAEVARRLAAAGTSGVTATASQEEVSRD